MSNPRLLRVCAGLASPAFLALASSTTGAQSLRLLHTHLPSGTPGAASFGTTIVGMGNLGPGGGSDYVIAAPTHQGGGLTAGQVEAFDGSTGNSLWRLSGSGTDLLGAAMASLGDITGDGKRELLVSAPGAPIVNGIRVLDGATGTPLLLTSSFSSPIVALAEFPADVDLVFPDGEPDAIVLDATSVTLLSSGHAQVNQVIGGFFFKPVSPQETVVSAAGDFFEAGTICVALGAPSENQVRVVDLVSGAEQTFKGTQLPGGVLGLGTALAFDPIDKRVLFGAPGSSGGRGVVGHIRKDSFQIDFTGKLGQSLGLSVSSGNFDNDSLSDILAGGVGAVRLVFGDGTDQEVAGSLGGTAGITFGSGVAVVGDTSGDGLDDFVVGNIPALTGGLADHFLGGPIARLNQNFGGGCSPTAITPLISCPAPFRPGFLVRVNIQNGSLTLCNVAVGTPNPLGTAVAGSPGCTSWLSAPVVAATVATDINGVATVILPIPVTTALLGQSFAIQEVVSFIGTPAIGLSNAISGVVGW